MSGGAGCLSTCAPLSPCPEFFNPSLLTLDIYPVGGVFFAGRSVGPRTYFILYAHIFLGLPAHLFRSPLQRTYSSSEYVRHGVPISGWVMRLCRPSCRPRPRCRSSASSSHPSSRPRLLSAAPTVCPTHVQVGRDRLPASTPEPVVAAVDVLIGDGRQDHPRRKAEPVILGHPCHPAELWERRHHSPHSVAVSSWSSLAGYVAPGSSRGPWHLEGRCLVAPRRCPSSRRPGRSTACWSAPA